MQKTDSKDCLGDRMKGYENREAFRHLDRVPFVARMDGRGFSKWTKGLKRPFDPRLTRLMIETTKYLVDATGAIVGFTQSDEITLVFHTDDHTKQHWYDSKHDKIVSHLGSIASNFFNFLLPDLIPEKVPQRVPHAAFCSMINPDQLGPCSCGAITKSKPHTIAEFDARCYTVPNLDEAANSVLWRQADAIRNSVQMAAQHHVGKKKLDKKNRREQLALLKQAGIEWDDFPNSFKWGTLVRRVQITRPYREDEKSQVPEEHRGNMGSTVTRNEIVELGVGPLKEHTNDQRKFILFGDYQPGAPLPSPEVL